MMRPRLFLFDPNLKSAHGHYLGYAARIGAAASDLGITTVMVASTNAIVSSPDFEVVPALALDYWQEMRPGAGEDPHDHLARSAETFASCLLALFEVHRISSSDAIFFPYVNLAEVMGLARLARQVGDSLPRTVLLFRRDLHEQGEDAGVGAKLGAGLLRQGLADLHASVAAGRIRLLTDSENLTEEYADGTRRYFQTAPIPVDPGFGSPLHHAAGPIRFVYLGDARTEKGYPVLPLAAEEIRAELTAGSACMMLQSNFNLPGGEPGIPEAREMLSRYPNVTLWTDPISDADYIACLRAADCVLLPYQADRYVSRTSGILAEAIHAGVPAIVPAGTWLSEQILRHGAGITYGAHDPSSIRKAVRAFMNERDRYRERAHSRREAFMQFHNPARLARFVCGADLIQQGAGFLRSHASHGFQLRTERPVALDSPDHQRPHGTRLDSSKNRNFNQRLYALFPGRTLRILDLGCSGGGFVRMCLDDGHAAVGLEGSDYSRITQRAEWKTIPSNLFTGDATHKFEILQADSDARKTRPVCFDVVTSWEFIEHIREEDLSKVCANVARHLEPGGIWILSVSTDEEVINGVRLHQTVKSRDWWERYFESAGFTHHPELVAYFEKDWVRGPLQNAPGSFHLALTLQGKAAPKPWNSNRTALEMA